MADEKSQFEQISTTRHPTLVREFAIFLRENKKWWLLPILVVLGLVGVLVVLGGTAAAPFIYTIF